jgi:hypothetical protein
MALEVGMSLSSLTVALVRFKCTTLDGRTHGMNGFHSAAFGSVSGIP